MITINKSFRIGFHWYNCFSNWKVKLNRCGLWWCRWVVDAIWKWWEWLIDTSSSHRLPLCHQTQHHTYNNLAVYNICHQWKKHDLSSFHSLPWITRISNGRECEKNISCFVYRLWMFSFIMFLVMDIPKGFY